MISIFGAFYFWRIHFFPIFGEFRQNFLLDAKRIENFGAFFEENFFEFFSDFWLFFLLRVSAFLRPLFEKTRLRPMIRPAVETRRGAVRSFVGIYYIKQPKIGKILDFFEIFLGKNLKKIELLR